MNPTVTGTVCVLSIPSHDIVNTSPVRSVCRPVHSQPHPHSHVCFHSLPRLVKLSRITLKMLSRPFFTISRLQFRNPPSQGAVTLQRCMYSGVVQLADEKAVDKFRMLNHKSVLYFTANWCGRK
jgi:hypothetical protein